MVAKKKPAVEVKDTQNQDYELVCIIKPELDEDGVDSRIEAVSQYITGNKGVVAGVEKWGKKKLAYPIDHSLEGYYVLTRFKISPTRCKELETNLKISEDILRYLLVKGSG